MCGQAETPKRRPTTAPRFNHGDMFEVVAQKLSTAGGTTRIVRGMKGWIKSVDPADADNTYLVHFPTTGEGSSRQVGGSHWLSEELLLSQSNRLFGEKIPGVRAAPGAVFVNRRGGAAHPILPGDVLKVDQLDSDDTALCAIERDGVARGKTWIAFKSFENMTLIADAGEQVSQVLLTQAIAEAKAEVSGG
jgi:hypothetical protein